MQTYTAFFNTEPQLGSLVVGSQLVWKKRANGDEWMAKPSTVCVPVWWGPIAGIGDSLVVGTLIPVLLGLPLAFLKVVASLVPSSTSSYGTSLVYFGMRFAFFKGYQLGDKAVEFLVGPKGQALRKRSALSVVWLSVP